MVSRILLCVSSLNSYTCSSISSKVILKVAGTMHDNEMYCAEARPNTRPSRVLLLNHCTLQQYEPAGQSGGKAWRVFHTMVEDLGGGSNWANQKSRGRNSPAPLLSEMLVMNTLSPGRNPPTYCSRARWSTRVSPSVALVPATVLVFTGTILCLTQPVWRVKSERRAVLYPLPLYEVALIVLRWTQLA